MLLKLTLRADRRPGFTLVELLVVITIIVVLAAISFLGIRSFKEKANETTSASNMRQMGIAIQTYVADKGRYPSPGVLGSDEFQVSWDRLILNNLASPDFDFKAGKYQPIRKDTPEGAALGNAASILFCPGDAAPAPSGQFRRSYSMCPWTISQAGPGFSNGFFSMKDRPGEGPPPSKIDDPSRAVVMIEFQHANNIVGTAAYDYLFGFLEMPQKNKKPANYHKNNQLLLFVDGHVGQCPGNISQVEWQKKGYSPHIDPVTGQNK